MTLPSAVSIQVRIRSGEVWDDWLTSYHTYDDEPVAILLARGWEKITLAGPNLKVQFRAAPK